MPLRHIISAGAIKSLWSNWAIAFGSIALVLLCALFIPKLWLPLLPFALAYNILMKLRSSSSNTHITGCNLILWAAVLILFWSAIIMTAINILRSDWLLGDFHIFEPYNPKHPYVCCLIVFPVALAVSVYMLVRGQRLKYCRRCQARFGYYSAEGIVSVLYFRESRYQLRLLLILSLVLSTIDWAYYYLFYINVNYNAPDKFYFIIMPIAVYVVSLVFMTARYVTLADQISDKPGKLSGARPMMTVVRFLVFSGDSAYLAAEDDGLLDTPARMIVPRRESMTVEQAAESFSDISGIKSAEIKYIYSDSGYAAGSNVLHFAAFVPEGNRTSRLGGSWLTIDELDRKLRAGDLSPMLVNEIYRIYNITMAWKTYDRNGRRLYPIKNYRPTFRLKDFKLWDVDYDDINWLDVATNNEDRPFFRLRRFWRRNFKH